MALLFSDEDFPLPAVAFLRQLGHDVVTIQERGLASQAVPDSDVLERAISEGRAILTFNWKHFLRLHSSRPDHAGIIICKADRRFQARYPSRRRHRRSGRLARSTRPRSVVLNHNLPLDALRRVGYCWCRHQPQGRGRAAECWP